MSHPLAPSGWRATESPFHSAELAVQERVGVRARMDIDARRGIRDYMPEQHRNFFSGLPFMLLGGLDATGQPWASMRIGAAGFVSSPDERTLRIAGHSPSGDPLTGIWGVGDIVGGLGIEPWTRRRNRVNGSITAMENDAMTITVSQSFGNCAKYIQSRSPNSANHDLTDANTVSIADRLSQADRDLLRRADTLFIASANSSAEAGLARGADVSHRGGKPGFVRIDDDRTLTMPDFSGNHFFNTIGNLVNDPRTGLLLIDFDSGDVLYIAADAEIIWEGPEVDAFAGAERLVRFHLREVRRSRGAMPFRWSTVEYAPQLARTGNWPIPAGPVQAAT